ncbi:MAG: prepilin-type N-terminal cleavage/methylation domain-containing protein [Planctomycetota bacterium]
MSLSRMHGWRERSPRTTNRPGFTLIELLVVISIIALLIGILLPALGQARRSAQRTADLSNIRQMGLAFTTYANDFEDWYPVLPTQTNDRFEIFGDQHIHGGVAGMFSHWQVGTETGTVDDPEGWSRLGGNINDSANFGGNKEPIMLNYIDGLGVLTSPAQKEAYNYHPATGPVINPGDINSIDRAEIVTPQAPSDPSEVISYNISYLYISGMKAVDPTIPSYAPLWGTETAGPDLSTDAWYGAGAGGGASALADSADTEPGFYSAKFDMFGDDGGNFVFSDGHAEFLQNEQSFSGQRLSIHDLFFNGEFKSSPSNINAIFDGDRRGYNSPDGRVDRSYFTQTID